MYDAKEVSHFAVKGDTGISLLVAFHISYSTVEHSEHESHDVAFYMLFITKK